MWKWIFEKLLAYFGTMYFEPDGTCWPLYVNDLKEEKKL